MDEYEITGTIIYINKDNRKEFKIKIEEFNSNQNKIQQENNNKEHLLKIKENEINLNNNRKSFNWL